MDISKFSAESKMNTSKVESLEFMVAEFLMVFVGSHLPGIYILYKN